jgi:hypothetical protein
MKIELHPFWVNPWARSIFIDSLKTMVDMAFMVVNMKIELHPFWANP